MPYVPDAGAGIIFMKVGTHANESLESILARKRRELEEAGVSFWGYGGGTCHPTTKVQPFVAKMRGEGKQVYLCMQEMTSKHFAAPVRAEEYSEDGVHWKAIPPAINVRGSRYALVLSTLDKTDFNLDLTCTRVGVGLQAGRPGAEYIRGRVDKACLEMTADPVVPAFGEADLKISLAARLEEPYAVLLR